MKDIITLAKVKALKPAKGFTVKDKAGRQAVWRATQELKKTKEIKFDVVTLPVKGGGFKVAAI